MRRKSGLMPSMPSPVSVVKLLIPPPLWWSTMRYRCTRTSMRQSKSSSMPFRTGCSRIRMTMQPLFSSSHESQQDVER